MVEDEKMSLKEEEIRRDEEDQRSWMATNPTRTRRGCD